MHDPVQHFIKECARLNTTLAEVNDAAGVPQEVARYIAAASLQSRCVGWQELSALEWAAVGIGFESRPATGDDLIGVTGCYCAIGETGTLLLLGAPATPKSTALLPETHICIARKSRMLPTMEDAFALVRNEIGEPPRAMFFVSGPSRTADIEQTMVLGAHGPYRVHLLIVGGQ
jgi:L-lactate dehydrogenase complex protein LldG